MHHRRRFLTRTAAILAAAGLSPLSLAQTLSRTARIIVGFPAGGSNDVLARHLAEMLRGAYAPSVIVENRVGAQGRIAVEAVKGAPADGASMLQTPASILTVYPHVFRNLSYDPLRDLTPVAPVCTFDLVMAVRADSPARSLHQLVDWCRANPKQAMYGSPAPGAIPHFVGVAFAKAAGIELLHVGYKGAAPAVQDLLGGQIPAYIGTLGDIIAHQKAGKVRALATSGLKRSRFAPEVTTFHEAGFKDVVAQEWYGILLPPGAPVDTVAKLNTAVASALDDRGFQEALARLNVDPAGGSAAAFAERIRSEQTSWGPVVKASGFSLD